MKYILLAASLLSGSAFAETININTGGCKIAKVTATNGQEFYFNSCNVDYTYKTSTGAFIYYTHGDLEKNATVSHEEHASMLKQFGFEEPAENEM